MSEDEEVCGETYDHDEMITYNGPDGIQWECRNCGAEGSQEVTSIASPDQVTDEIQELACYLAKAWYPLGEADWEGLLGRLDGAQLADGTVLRVPEDRMAPGVQKLKRLVWAKGPTCYTV